MAALASLGRLFLDAVAPRRCAACDQVSQAPICSGCVATLMEAPPPPPVRLAAGRALAGFVFEDAVREVLHRGKFQGDRDALRQAAELVALRLDVRVLLPRPDAVLALPLGSRRRRQRGYNQAEVVARVLAAAAGLPLLAGLARLRETAPQTRRDEAARRRNIDGAFAWRGSGLEGARLWLVDDVLTTGATIDAAAAVLRRAGAARVDAILVARVP